MIDQTASERPNQLVVGVVQTNSQDNPQDNLDEVLAGIDRAARMGAQFVSLPETWNYLGDDDGAVSAATGIPGELTDTLAEKAREHRIWLHAGSVLERVEDDERLANTTVVFSPSGETAARYRKIHLFDVDIAGQPSFRESDTIAPGDRIVTFDMGGLRVGLAICYDVRFPEIFRAMALEGAEVIMLPAAFTLMTGKDHWEPLIRARAIENTVFMVAAAQVGPHPPGRMCYGRSMVVDPWGVILAQAGDIQTVVIATLEMDEIARVRGQIPSLQNRMPHLYPGT